MDNRAEIREFLSTRRAKITPAQVGLPAGTGLRRVPGLRREEVAVLAGVSADWYIRLEKGHIDGVSDDVLDEVARALQLDDADPGLTLTVCSTEVGSTSEDALKLLASWTATRDEGEHTRAETRTRP
jgi:transcriptional regulator with XRE-family HTH domain